MAENKRGRQTVVFRNPPVITHTFSIAGPKEGRGPLGGKFHRVLPDLYYGEKSWEKAEIKMLRDSIQELLASANLSPGQTDLVLAGDLLNQNIAASFALRELPIPFVGLFNACATFADALLLGAMLVDGGYVDTVVAAASSHYATAERQYRYPLELGVQRRPTAQRTVTGSGAVLLQTGGKAPGPKITAATLGIVQDMGLRDVNDMGSAMAPAAAATIEAHLSDLGRKPDYYDLIVSGDLASVGLAITKELLQQKQISVQNNMSCCGIMIYDLARDGVEAGGSGAGCSATVFAAHLYRELVAGNLHKLLFVGTGSLHSPTTYQQGESIPTIAHAVAVEA